MSSAFTSVDRIMIALRRRFCPRLSLSTRELSISDTHDRYGWHLLSDGSLVHFDVCGMIHHDRKPAIIHADGTEEWWCHGKWHRDDDLPAIMRQDGLGERWMFGRFEGFYWTCPPTLDIALQLWRIECSNVKQLMDYDDVQAHEVYEARAGIDTAFLALMDSLDEQVADYSYRAAHRLSVPMQWQESLRDMRETYTRDYRQTSQALEEVERLIPDKPTLFDQESPGPWS